MKLVAIIAAIVLGCIAALCGFFVDDVDLRTVVAIVACALVAYFVSLVAPA